jgi:hypothetical protein
VAPNETEATATQRATAAGLLFHNSHSSRCCSPPPPACDCSGSICCCAIVASLWQRRPLESLLHKRAPCCRRLFLVEKNPIYPEVASFICLSLSLYPNKVVLNLIGRNGLVLRRRHRDGAMSREAAMCLLELCVDTREAIDSQKVLRWNGWCAQT